MYTYYGWVSLLYIRNWHSTMSQIYPNLKKKEKKENYVKQYTHSHTQTETTAKKKKARAFSW